MAKWFTTFVRWYSEHWHLQPAANVAFPALGGIIFLVWWAIGTGLLHAKPSFGSTLVVLIATVGGTLLIAVTFIDVTKRALAKYYLACKVAELTLPELDYLKWRVIRPMAPLVLGPPFHRFEGNSARDEDSGWPKLVTFLETDPLGTMASDALFQRSRSGRLRYLHSVMQYAEQRRARGML
jgi:hypothetical protein